MKNLIFHIPNHIETGALSGSQIRPIKMLEAFRDNGYNVDIVMGYGKERKQQIKKIKQKIKKGKKYEFLYSENSTMPTLLTEKKHLPKYPFLDFGFFKFCKKNNIKIGLFYRDVYWQFSEYRISNSLKIKISDFFYKYDLKQYNKYIDVLYLPSLIMKNYIPFDFNSKIIKELPPAIDVFSKKDKTTEITKINIFYVGGIGQLYQFANLLKVVNKTEEVELTFCVRENEWEVEKNEYSEFLNERIKVIHKSGKELLPFYEKANITSLFVKPIEYRTFAMPVKLFEYLNHRKPVIASKGTAVGDFVEKYNVGWVINYDVNELTTLLTELKNNPAMIQEKEKNIENIITEISWGARVNQVIKDLQQLQD